MAELSHLRVQADRCRRLARDVNDPLTRERLEKLAGEYEARANAQDGEEVAVKRRAGAAEG
jgi:hypothetical protein